MAQRRGGGGGPVKQVIWFAILAMIGLALWRGVSDEKPGDVFNWFKNIGENAGEATKNLTDPIKDFLDGKGGKDDKGGSESGSGGQSGEESGGGSGEGASGSGSGGGGESSASGEYNRDEWNHWVNVRSCWTVREQVLYRDAESVVLVDENDKPTDDVNKACKVTGGVWIDRYTGNKITDPSSIDIDHMVPLAEAARSGGQEWDADRKEAYANNLDNDYHLVAVSASANRAKGDKDPALWMPSNKDYACEYVNNWVSVKDGWGLSMDEAEQAKVDEVLSGC